MLRPVASVLPFLPIALVVLSSVFACGKDAAPPPPPGDSSFGGTSGTPSGTTSNGGTPSSSGSNGNTSGAPPARTVYVDLTKETFDFNGASRYYYLGKPKTYDAGKTYPLVMEFHGNPGTPEDMMTGLPYDASSQNDAVLAYPASADPGGWDLYDATADNADMDFPAAVVADVKKKANVDTQRVFGFGYSGGAFFVVQLTCRIDGVFKAISVNAGGGPDEPDIGCKKKDSGCCTCAGSPIPTLITHGQADTEVTPDSGDFTAQCAAEANGCNTDESALVATTPSPCQKYDGCDQGKGVTRCFVPGQTHAPWANAVQTSWDFFKSL